MSFHIRTDTPLSHELTESYSKLATLLAYFLLLCLFLRNLFTLVSSHLVALLFFPFGMILKF